MYICEINNIENEKKGYLGLVYSFFFECVSTKYERKESHLYLFGLNKNNLTFKTKQHNNKKNSFSKDIYVNVFRREEEKR